MQIHSFSSRAGRCETEFFQLGDNASFRPKAELSFRTPRRFARNTRRRKAGRSWSACAPAPLSRSPPAFLDPCANLTLFPPDANGSNKFVSHPAPTGRIDIVREPLKSYGWSSYPWYLNRATKEPGLRQEALANCPRGRRRDGYWRAGCGSGQPFPFAGWSGDWGWGITRASPRPSAGCSPVRLGASNKSSNGSCGWKQTKTNRPCHFSDTLQLSRPCLSRKRYG
jgi:hypothetical protein